jgi:hypothetical protein
VGRGDGPVCGGAALLPLRRAPARRAPPALLAHRRAQRGRQRPRSERAPPSVGRPCGLAAPLHAGRTRASREALRGRERGGGARELPLRVLSRGPRAHRRHGRARGHARGGLLPRHRRVAVRGARAARRPRRARGGSDGLARAVVRVGRACPRRRARHHHRVQPPPVRPPSAPLLHLCRARPRPPAPARARPRPPAPARARPRPPLRRARLCAAPARAPRRERAPRAAQARSTRRSTRARASTSRSRSRPSSTTVRLAFGAIPPLEPSSASPVSQGPGAAGQPRVPSGER